MNMLKFILMMLTIVGCWQPFMRKSFKYTLYNTYTLFIISAMCTFTFTQFMDIVLNVDNPEDFINVMYMMVSMCGGCYKIFNLWMDQDSIVILIHKLTEDLFKPLVPDESKMQRKCDRMIHIYAKTYIGMVEITCAGTLLVSLLTDFRDRKLSFREWVPYDYSSYMIFCLTYAYQLLNIIICAFVSTACDSLIIGLLLHLCCQIGILKYRLRNIKNNPNSLRTCIHHHHQIIAYAYALNKRFTTIIAFQFVTSTFVICSNLYQITKTRLSANHIPLICYTYCMLMQIFIYCWFGNKLKVVSLQVVDTIFDMDWMMLDIKMKKSLLLIMNRAIVPLEFNCAYILNMNLESFVSLLKTSYSAYNLLIQV